LSTASLEQRQINEERPQNGEDTASAVALTPQLIPTGDFFSAIYLYFSTANVVGFHKNLLRNYQNYAIIS
jgi:hypothetical protein